MALVEKLKQYPGLVTELLIALDSEAHNVDTWVFGLPLHHDASMARMCAIVMAWVAELESMPPLPVKGGPHV